MGERRAALVAADRELFSERASARLLELPQLVDARAVAAFLAARAEADPRAALDAIERRGLTVVYPRVSAASPRLRFHSVAGAQDLRQGYRGLIEPAPECPERSVEFIDVFVVPGLAFDGKGRRLGYGGGHYDELVAHTRALGSKLFVGFCYDFQVVESCPAWDGDQAIDCIVTEARAIICDPARAMDYAK